MLRRLLLAVPIIAIMLLATGCPPPASYYGTGEINAGYTSHHVQVTISDSALSADCITANIDGDYPIVGWINIGWDKRPVVCNGGYALLSADSMIGVDHWRLSICRWADNKATACTVVAQVTT